MQEEEMKDYLKNLSNSDKWKLIFYFIQIKESFTNEVYKKIGSIPLNKDINKSIIKSV